MLFLLSTALAVASTFLPTTNALMMACNNTVNGVLYDLNPLHALGDIKVTPLMGAYDYYFNVCGAVQGPCASHPGAFSCQVRKSPPDQFEAVQAYSDIDTHTPAPVWGPSAGSAGGVKLTFTNGDSCNLRQRIMNIDFQCDYNGTRAITIDENPQCTYNVIYPTKVVCQAPTTAAPTTEAPTTKAPTTEVPTTAAPTTEAPTTKAPTTEAPTTLAPTTEAPTTAAPTTKAPTTEVPTTAAPTTEAPTHAPTTEAPTTEAPTTAAPTTHAPTSTPTPAGSEMMSCNHTVNGTNYDLSPLHALGDVKVIPQAGAYDYYINVCGAVGGPCASHPSAFACQVRKSPADQFESVVAYTNMTNHTEPVWGPSAGLTGGVQLTFINGDSCNLRQRKMKIDFQCDINGTRAITIDENPQCTFNIIYPTQVVCPGYVPPTTAAPTTAAPTTDAPTYLPTTAAPTTHAPTSTPTSASSTYDENTITRAGLGAGIGIGVGCLAIVWLLWCCYDRRRVQQQVQADAYAPLTSSSV